jgi:hypothetical protein
VRKEAGVDLDHGFPCGDVELGDDFVVGYDVALRDVAAAVGGVQGRTLAALG